MNDEPRLQVRFYRTAAASNEPVREWLKALPPEERKIIGDDLKTAQYGWPLGMPLIRKLEPGFCEVRSRLDDRIARVIITVEDDTMVLLPGFIKKAQKIPPQDLQLARQRLRALHEVL
jgi:phage-related protein